jgi:hypothetical protein
MPIVYYIYANGLSSYARVAGKLALVVALVLNRRLTRTTYAVQSPAWGPGVDNWISLDSDLKVGRSQ